MNIKMRMLLFSVSLILVLLLVGLTLGWGAKRLVFERRESYSGISYNVPDFFEVMAKKASLIAANPAEVPKNVDKFNGYNGDKKLALSAYEGDRLVAGRSLDVDPNLLRLAMEGPGEHVMVMGGTAIYSKPAGPYRLVLVDTDYEGADGLSRSRKMRHFLWVSVSALVISVLIVSAAVSRFVYKYISRALDTLSHGVHQLRDGNLEYRIKYTRCDEFTQVCQDFNEMAERLWESVKQRCQDEESRRHLIAGISHDLRTPLTSIKAYAEGLAGGVAATPEKRAKYIETIRMKAEHMEKILQQLILFSKLDVRDFPLDLEVVDLGRELGKIVESVKDEYDLAGLDISFQNDGGGSQVKLDLAQLRNAMYNVFENSLKYKDKERGHLAVKMFASNGHLTVSLTDDGPGVPAELAPRLFEVFYRCDEARSNTSQGSGLGLAITAKIVTQLGGTIMAENAAGGGLAIVITFPEAGEARV